MPQYICTKCGYCGQLLIHPGCNYHGATVHSEQEYSDLLQSHHSLCAKIEELKEEMGKKDLQKSELETRLAEVLRVVSNPPKLTSIDAGKCICGAVMVCQSSEAKRCDCMTILEQTKDAMETSGMNLEANGVGEAMAALRGHHALKSLTEKRNHEVTVIEAPRRVCWFAEVNPESKAACSACKPLTWPRWISSKGNFLTDDPNEAKWWETREQAEAFCLQGHVRHWHLYPTKHMFVS